MVVALVVLGILVLGAVLLGVVGLVARERRDGSPEDSILPHAAPTPYRSPSPGPRDDASVLTAWLLAEATRQTGVDVKEDAMARQRVEEAATRALAELATARCTEINLPFLAATADGPKHVALRLTRDSLAQVLGSR